jgi:hypothetical protein
VGQFLTESGLGVIVADTSADDLNSALASRHGWIGRLNASTSASGAAVIESARAFAGRLDVLVQHHPTVSRVVAAEMDIAA